MPELSKNLYLVNTEVFLSLNRQLIVIRETGDGIRSGSKVSELNHDVIWDTRDIIIWTSSLFKGGDSANQTTTKLIGVGI